MKRLVLRLSLIAAAALLCAGLAASAAFGFASNFDYYGHVRGSESENVGFSIETTAAGRKKVVGFTISNIQYTCSDAAPGSTAGWEFDQSMRIRPDRTFSGRGDWVELPLDPVGTVSGQLRRGGLAVGDFKIRGELAGPGTHCHSGLLDWRAKKAA